MSVLSPMTDLEAVNRMLASIGQAPVNTLAISGVGDVAKATQQLLETARDVQTVGYSWNTEYGMTLTADSVTGYIAIPSGALDIDASDTTQNLVVRRLPDDSTLGLYDADNHTYTFTDPVTVDVIWGYEFNDLPQAARSYISTAAARRFQAQTVSSPILDRYNAEDEERAFVLLQRYERRSRDTNSFRRSASLQKWIGRRAF